VEGGRTSSIESLYGNGAGMLSVFCCEELWRDQMLEPQMNTDKHR
jgi:hypothetical protein